MTILADENIDGPIVYRLRAAGYKVTWIMEEERSITDPIVLSKAFEAQSLLVTKDKGFGDLVFSKSLKTAGVLLLRMHTPDIMERADRMLHLLSDSGDDLLGKFTVLTDANFRVKMISKK